jgi:hypothetical protein
MDSSQLTRLRQEAANVYISRMKTVDSSFLTLQRQQLAAYSGSSVTNAKASPYYKGAPIVNPIMYDISSCPIDHSIINGYSNSEKLSQQEDRAARIAGGILCNQPDYSKISPGMQLLNCSTVNTILTSYYRNTSSVGVWPAYGHGINKFFPRADNNSQSTCCVANKYPYPSG